MRLANLFWVLLFVALLVWGGVRMAKNGALAVRGYYAPFGAYVESQQDKR